ncbi:MAG: AI-2E family transporter, partial [bacterium]
MTEIDPLSRNESASLTEGNAGPSRAIELKSIRRILSLILLMLLMIAFYFAKEVVLPLLMGTLLALTLSPVVRGLQKAGLPPAISATTLIFLIAVAIGGSILVMKGPISTWIDEAPGFENEVKAKLQTIASSLAVVKKASEQVENIAAGETDATVQKVAVQSPGFLTLAVSNVVSIGAAFLVTLVLALFLLASGDMFYIKLIDVFPRFGDKKRALRIVYGIERSVSRYLFLVTMINTGLGVVIGLEMWAIGMPKPLVWAVFACLVNFLPYIGPLLGVGLATLVALVSFDNLGHAALVPVVYLTTTSVEGQFLTPIILGRQLELNTVAVFVTVVFWGWLWGV